MPIYLITTDLSKTDTRIEQLEFEINILAHDRLSITRPELVKDEPKFKRILSSTWFLKTELSSDAITFNLKQSVPTLTNFLVIQIDNDYQGDLESGVWDWLDKFSD